MPIERDLWETKWQEGEFPTLPCPTCSAHINVDPESLSIRTSNHNIALVDVTDYDKALSRFNGWYVCVQSTCAEIVSVSGYCTYHQSHDEAGAPTTERVFHPKVMLPGPPLIRVSEETPAEIQEVLKSSFDMYWADLDACVGRLRVALEMILAAWGFPAHQPTGKFRTLHQRIEDWLEVYGAESIAKSLMAIKWLGNVGAHDRTMSSDRILDAYEILERLLQDFFPRDDRDLDRLAEEIISTKGRG